MADVKFERPATLTAVVAEYIRHAIIGGRFVPGSRLPEIPLATELQTSRGTIREALHVLRNAGLVEMQPHRGAIVSRLSIQTVEEVTELRALLESYAVRVALARGPLSPTSLASVGAAFTTLQDVAAGDDIFAIVEADAALHATISACSGNETLLAMLAYLQTRTRQFILLSKIYSSDTASEVEAHAPLLAALRAGDRDAAEAVAREHVLLTGRQLLARMSGDGTGRRVGGASRTPAGEAGRRASDLPARFRPAVTAEGGARPREERRPRSGRRSSVVQPR